VKQKSLRQLAKELGVSASYLSQVKHGKRSASAKLLDRLSSYEESVKQSTEVAEMLSKSVKQSISNHY
jgi:transcriptional regulator with XRE-family HTH domain